MHKIYNQNINIQNIYENIMDGIRSEVLTVANGIKSTLGLIEYTRLYDLGHEDHSVSSSILIEYQSMNPSKSLLICYSFCKLYTHLFARTYCIPSYLLDVGVTLLSSGVKLSFPAT